MTQPQLNLDVPASVVDHAGSVADAGRGAAPSQDDQCASPCAGVSTPCQNPGCPHHIVPADASDERCPDCGHAIRDEEVMCNDDDRPTVEAADTATGASHKRPAKAPASPPDPAGSRSIAARIVHLAQQLALTDAEQGELNVLMERHCNTDSPKLLHYLYDDPPAGWGLQKRFIKDGAKNTTKLSRSIDALLANYRVKPDPRLELCLILSDRRTQLETLQCKLDPDGRIRFSLNIAGTKIGRMSCNASSTGSGYGMHSTQDAHKHLFPAAPGHDFYQVDLTGADSWTVAAECRALGDPTMWDDMSAGLKPAKALSALYLDGEAANHLPRADLLARCKALPKDWVYNAAKKATHGSCYGEGDVKMAETLLRDSWEEGGKLATVTAAQCRKLQDLFFKRYPGVRRWQERVRMLLARDGCLTAASGLRRDFFGRKDDHATQKEAYAFCPAANTAHVNNCAILNIWRDPDNRTAGDERIAKLRLQVHDSVLFEAPQDRRDWVKAKIAQWWDTPITVAGTTFTMGYEAQFGPSWGVLTPL